VALRTAMNLRRNRDDLPALDVDDVLVQKAAGDDPEAAYVRAHYQQAFLLALKEAIGGLSAERRNVLRLRFACDLSRQQIAGVLKVSRGTVVRWLATARREVLDRTLAILRARLRLTPSELESLVRLARSELPVTIGSLLREGGEP